MPCLHAMMLHYSTGVIKEFFMIFSVEFIFRIVGMIIASMIAVELMRICFSWAATGPTGSRTPRLQAEVRRISEAKAATRQAAHMGRPRSAP